MGEVEIQGLDLSGFILVTQKAAGAAAVPRMNFHLILSSSSLSVDQDILPDPRNIKNFSFIHASPRWTQSVCPIVYNCETEAEITAEELGCKWSEVLRDVGAPSPTRAGKEREKRMSLQVPFPPFFSSLALSLKFADGTSISKCFKMQVANLPRIKQHNSSEMTPIGSNR